MHNIFGEFEVIHETIFRSFLRWWWRVLVWHYIDTWSRCECWSFHLCFLNLILIVLYFIHTYVGKLLFIILIHDHERVDYVEAIRWCSRGYRCSFTLLLLVNYVVFQLIGFIQWILLRDFNHSLIENNWTSVVINPPSRPVEDSNHLSEFAYSVCFRMLLMSEKEAVIGIITDEWLIRCVTPFTCLSLIAHTFWAFW